MVTEKFASITEGFRTAFPQAPLMGCSPELFETIETIFLFTSPIGEIQFINRVFRYVTRSSHEEAEGRMFWDLFFHFSQQDFIQIYSKKPSIPHSKLPMNTPGAAVAGERDWFPSPSSHFMILRKH